MVAEDEEVACLHVDVGLIGKWRDLVGVAEELAADAVLLAELGQQTREGVVLGGETREKSR